MQTGEWGGGYNKRRRLPIILCYHMLNYVEFVALLHFFAHGM